MNKRIDFTETDAWSKRNAKKERAENARHFPEQIQTFFKRWPVENPAAFRQRVNIKAAEMAEEAKQKIGEDCQCSVSISFSKLGLEAVVRCRIFTVAPMKKKGKK